MYIYLSLIIIEVASFGLGVAKNVGTAKTRIKMDILTRKCPNCGNIVEGKVKRSTLSKGVRGVIKKGGMKGVLTAAGSVIPGFGNVTGFLAGAAIDAIYGDQINQAVDEATDIFMEDNVYEFKCPNCGKIWSSINETEQNYYFSSNDLKNVYLVIKDIIIDKLGVDESEITPNTTFKQLEIDSLDAVELVMEAEKHFCIVIHDDEVEKIKTVLDATCCVNALLNPPEDEEESEESVFDHYWNFFLDNTDDILETRESLDEFLREMDSDMPRYEFNHSNPEYSMMQYLKSWAILLFILDNGDEEGIIDRGTSAINNCNKGAQHDAEYQYMKVIYDMMNVDESEPKAFGICNKIYQDSSSYIITDSLLKPESLRKYLDIFYYKKLSAIVEEIENKKNYQQAIKVYQKMAKIDYYYAKAEGYGRLSQYYRYDDFTGIENDSTKAFDYSKKCINQFEIDKIEESDLKNYYGVLFIDNLGYAALMYSIGDEKNPKKAYDLATKGYELGDGYCAYLLATFIEEGIGTKPNIAAATKCYKDAVERGCELAVDKLKKIENDSTSNNQNINESEQEYFDALKEYLSDGVISERERRMLERVRKALGISEEKAAEMESSLKQPVLTEDEKEYVEAYREYLVGGTIDEKSRKRLDIFRRGLGISEARAVELEKINRK